MRSSGFWGSGSSETGRRRRRFGSARCSINRIAHRTSHTPVPSRCLEPCSATPLLTVASIRRSECCKFCGWETVDDMPYIHIATDKYVMRVFKCIKCPVDEETGKKAGTRQRLFVPIDAEWKTKSITRKKIDNDRCKDYRRNWRNQQRILEKRIIEKRITERGRNE